MNASLVATYAAIMWLWRNNRNSSAVEYIIKPILHTIILRSSNTQSRMLNKSLIAFLPPIIVCIRIIFPRIKIINGATCCFQPLKIVCPFEKYVVLSMSVLWYILMSISNWPASDASEFILRAKLFRIRRLQGVNHILCKN